MGDITAALRTAASGLLTNQAALQIIANNIANVNTDGYSRKIINPETVVISGRGVGVKLSDVSRRVDEGLLRSLRLENSELNTFDVQEDYFTRLQVTFGSPGGDTGNISISHLVEKFSEALEVLAVSPENSLEAFQVVRNADEMLSRLKDMNATIQELRLQTDIDITDVVNRINTSTTKIDKLNDEIIANSSVGRDVSDLRDQRDQELDNLSSFIDMRYFTRSDGDVVAFTSAGRTLVDTLPPIYSHTSASTVTATTTHSEGDIAGIYVGTVVAGNDITNEVREGQLKGLIDLRDKILPGLQAQLDELATEIRDTVNQIHNRGISFPGAQSMTGSRIFVDPTNQTMTVDSTNGADDTTIALFDSDGSQTAVTTLETLMTGTTFGDTVAKAANGPWVISEVASRIQGWLRANGAATADATINAAGKFAIELNVTSLSLAFRDETATAAGSTAADVSIGFNANAVGGDTVIDETVNGFSNFFGLNDFFVDSGTDSFWESNIVSSTTSTPGAAQTLTFRDSTGTLTGSPLTVAAGTSLTALATLITLNVTNITATVVPEGDGSRLRIAHENGSSITVTQATGDTLLTDFGLHRGETGLSALISVRSDIVAEPLKVSKGQPQWNASFGVAGEYFMSPGDDSVIQQLAALFTTNNDFDKAGGLSALKKTFSAYAAEIISTNSIIASDNERLADTQRSLVESLTFKSDSVRGVNLDEEMADLIIFEQAFSAAARVIAVIQEMIKALERAVG